MSFRQSPIGLLPKEWMFYKLSECSNKITDGTHSTVKDNPEGNYYLLSCKNIKGGNVVLGNKERLIDLDTLNKLRKRTGLQTNDILITTVGTIGESAIVNDKVINYELQRSVAIIRPDIEKFNPKFMYYITKDRRFIGQCNGMIKGSVQKCLYLGEISNIVVPCPKIEEQIVISKILSSLDQKIETNNKINKNLEEITQAIFKQWFIDFEFPNENGEPYKSSGGEMIKSEMGMIPKGWEISKLVDKGTIITGKTPSTKDEDNYGDNYDFITPVDMNGEYFVINSQRRLSKNGYEKVKKFIIEENSIGVTCIGSNLGEVYINAYRCFTNQQINSLILKEKENLPYLYITLKNMKNDFLNISGGSAVPIINKSTFSNINIVWPSNKILQGFYKLTTIIFEKMKENLIENKELVNLRDTLLPKLMSGEIRVPLD